jgi:hypothetical protein
MLGINTATSKLENLSQVLSGWLKFYHTLDFEMIKMSSILKILIKENATVPNLKFKVPSC